MKIVLMAIALGVFGVAGITEAQTHQVKAYTRKDGTYVPAHTASNPDAHRYNNRSSRTNGGTQRDEYSDPSATNKKNASYRSSDNDKDGVSNAYDSAPEDKTEN